MTDSRPDPKALENECWVCGKVAPLYSSAIPPEQSAIGFGWCGECHEFGETQTVEAVKNRLLGRVRALVPERDALRAERDEAERLLQQGLVLHDETTAVLVGALRLLRDIAAEDYRGPMPEATRKARAFLADPKEPTDG